MGKKRATIIGSEDESALIAKKAVKKEQKKLREGKPVAPKSDTDPTTKTTQVTETPLTETKKSDTKETKVHHRGSKYQTAKSQVDPLKTYSLEDGLNLLRKVSFAKFDPSVELHITLKEKGFSKEVELPHSNGKTKKIAVADEATIKNIEAGKIDFDVLIASPAMMSKLIKLAKILGPRGLMPNPKNGTVAENPEKTAKDMARKISVNLKTEKDAPVVHTLVGKLSMTDKVLSENIKAVLENISGSRKIVLKSSMSPAIKLQV